MDPRNNVPNSGKMTAILWVASGVLAIGLLFARAVYPELLWLTIAIAVLLVVTFALLVKENQRALKSRSVAFGVNSAVTVVLVVAILSVLNFLVSRYPKKLDLTKNKVHTLSDQTEKVVKGLNKEVQAVMFAKSAAREEFKPILDNYKALNPKFMVEYVDPDKEPTRAKQAGIKKYGTLHLSVGGREQSVDEVNEEKLTNALIKLSKEKTPTFCAITGHGERSFTSNEADGYSGVKRSLENQAYAVKDVSMVNEGKIPADCDAIALIGPQKPFIGNDMKLVSEYLAGGGRAIIALDIDISKGMELSPEVVQLLKAWHVNPSLALIVDPVSRMFGVDASSPLVGTFSSESPITKEFRSNAPSVFPFTRPLEVVPGAPAELKITWLAQSTPQSWGVVDIAKLAKNPGVKLEANDKKGPLNVAVSVDGKQKDSKAPRNTRIVAFGSSLFAANQHSRMGLNEDLFLNAASWVLEDESLISIRAKEDAPSRVEMSSKQGTVIFLLTVFIMPLLIAASGIGIWAWRRRL